MKIERHGNATISLERKWQNTFLGTNNDDRAANRQSLENLAEFSVYGTGGSWNNKRNMEIRGYITIFDNKTTT